MWSADAQGYAAVAVLAGVVAGAGRRGRRYLQRRSLERDILWGRRGAEGVDAIPSIPSRVTSIERWRAEHVEAHHASS